MEICTEIAENDRYELHGLEICNRMNWGWWWGWGRVE